MSSLKNLDIPIPSAWTSHLPLLVGTGLLILSDVYHNTKRGWLVVAPVVIVVLAFSVSLFLRYRFPMQVGGPGNQPQEFFFLCCMGLIFYYWAIIHLAYRKLRLDHKLAVSGVVILALWSMLNIYLCTNNMMLWMVVVFLASVSIAAVAYDASAHDPKQADTISIIMLILAFSITYGLSMMRSWTTFEKVFGAQQVVRKSSRRISMGLFDITSL